MRAARKAEDRILLGGDVFDLVLPSDKRRYTPDGLHPRLRGRSDVVNEAVEWAVEHFGPFADHIDGVGVGNHETAAIRAHHYDAVSELVRRLNQKRRAGLSPVTQLGYTAYLDYRIVPAEGARPVARYVVWYHHGSGKSSDTTVALKRLLGYTASFAADLYWTGHSHSCSSAREVMIHCGKSGALTTRDVLCVVTGAYTQVYGHQGQKSMISRGRRSNYGSEAGYRPHALGGARVVLHWKEPGFPCKVEVVH